MLPFDLIGINHLLGSKAVEVSGSIAKVSDLDMDADDLLLATLKYDNNIQGNVIIETLSRKPIFILHLIGTKGSLEWSRYDSVLKVYDIDSNKTENIDLNQGHTEPDYVNTEEPYIAEIKAFLDAIAGNSTYPHSFEANYQLLNTLYALEKSNETGTIMNIE